VYFKHEFGKFGEELAINFLIQKGYKIIEKNFLCKQGELDIIAKNENEIVFVEVKTRTSIKYGNPIEAVNKIKIKHMYNSAQFYLYKNGLQNSFVRFDIIEIYIKNKYCYIKHHKQII